MEMPDGSRRNLSANKIREFVLRESMVGFIRDEDADFGEVHYNPVSE